MKKILKYFLDNLKMTINLTFIILICGFLIFLFFEFIDFVVAMLKFVIATSTSPVVGFIVSILLLIIIISILLTLLDMFFNKSD